MLSVGYACISRVEGFFSVSRSKSQSVIRFSSSAVANRVLAALKDERRSGKNQKNIEFDFMSTKAVKMFVETMSEQDKIENQKSK